MLFIIRITIGVRGPEQTGVRPAIFVILSLVRLARLGSGLRFYDSHYHHHAISGRGFRGNDDDNVAAIAFFSSGGAQCVASLTDISLRWSERVRLD